MRIERAPHGATAAVPRPLGPAQLLDPRPGRGPAELEVPQLALDELLRQLVDRAREVSAAQRRLGGLLRANRMITDDLALPVVLRHIADAARELVAARYGTLTVLAPGGGEEFRIDVGIEPDFPIAAAVARTGLLAAMIVAPGAVRVPDLVGGTSVLGVAIRVRDAVLGTLYVCGHDDDELVDEDEELMYSLASTAGVAIENARLFDEARRQQDWLEAATDITRRLLSDEGEEPLRLIARRVQQIARADAVNVVLPSADGDRLRIQVATGVGSDELGDLTYPMGDTASETVLQTAQPMLLSGSAVEGHQTVHLSRVVPIGPLMVLPLVGSEGVRGTLVVGRLRGRDPFTATDLQMATAFANHAAIALERADARADAERLALLGDRDRIARDLHDHVIQRLFGAGLTVQSVVSRLGADPRAQRLTEVVDDIDQTIRQIRTTIFRLRGPLGPRTGAVREALVDVAVAVAPTLGFEPGLVFVGPIDAVVPEAVLDDLTAVLREGLTNVARHARAHTVEVTVSATPDGLSLDIVDDGVGMGDAHRRSGLANLRERAEQQGGELVVGPARGSAPGGPPTETDGGTRLRWTIPLAW